MEDKKITLEAGKTYCVPVKQGTLEIRLDKNGDDSSINMEYISNMEQHAAGDETALRPHIMVECHKNKLSVVTWGNTNSEDYSNKTVLQCPDDGNLVLYKKLLSTKDGLLFHAGEIFRMGGEEYIKDLDHGEAHHLKEISPGLTKEQFFLQEKYRTYGLELIGRQAVSRENDNVFFYGGKICTIRPVTGCKFYPGNTGASISLCADGNVKGSLYRGEKKISSFGDTANAGSRGNTLSFIETNKALADAQARFSEKLSGRKYTLLLEQRNWLKLYFCKAEGQENVGTATIAYTENIFEVLDDVLYFVKKCREILGTRKQVFAVNIEWDITDENGEQDVELPPIVLMPDGIAEDDADAMTDYLSDITGYCVFTYDTAVM